MSFLKEDPDELFYSGQDGQERVASWRDAITFLMVEGPVFLHARGVVTHPTLVDRFTRCRDIARLQNFHVGVVGKLTPKNFDWVKNRIQFWRANGVERGGKIVGRIFPEANAISFWNTRAQVTRELDSVNTFLRTIGFSPRKLQWEFIDTMGVENQLLSYDAVSLHGNAKRPAPRVKRRAKDEIMQLLKKQHVNPAAKAQALPPSVRGSFQKGNLALRGQFGTPAEFHAVHIVGESKDSLALLKQKLLARGGTRFQLTNFLQQEIPEDVAVQLLQAGKFFSGKRALFKKMEANSCHANVRRLGPGVQPWFGLALSGDGIWRVHSWGRSNRGIIETTEPRLLYYGIPD